MTGLGRRIVWIAAFALALAAWAEETNETEETKKAETEASASEEAAQPQQEERAPDARVVYVPPSRGAARARVGGGTRGPEVTPTVAVLAPDHVGVTWRAQPTFAWFLSDATDRRIDFTLIEEDAIEPLVEVTLPGPIAAGIHRVDLADHGARLEAGRSYDWSVALVADPASRDLDRVAGAAIRRDPAPGGAAPGARSYGALAAAGVWYDAVAELSEAIAASPDDASLRRQRADLLEQVGVGAAAAFEREKGADAVEAPPP